MDMESVDVIEPQSRSLLLLLLLLRFFFFDFFPLFFLLASNIITIHTRIKR